MSAPGKVAKRKAPSRKLFVRYAQTCIEQAAHAMESAAKYDAEPLVVCIEDREELGVLAVAAPPGMCWEPGLHEITEPYTEPRWRPEARKALLTAIDHRTVERCEDKKCEWCIND